MMAFCKKSLSEDAVDYYSHTWAFVFLILCVLVSLSLPLTWTQSQMPEKTSDRVPRFKAICWAPAHFTNVLIEFTHTVCSSAANDLVKGHNSSAAKLFQFESEPEIVPINVEKKTGMAPEQFHQLYLRSKPYHYDRVKGRDLINYKAPLYLFLFAICLRLPCLIQSMLSLSFGCVNVDQTLLAIQSAQSVKNNDKQGELASLIKAFPQSSKKATVLYLLMKVLMIIIIIGEIIVTTENLLGETVKRERDLDSIRNSKTDIKSFSELSHEEKTSLLIDYPTSIDSPIMCQFSMRQLNRIQTFLVQCVFKEEEIRDSVLDSSGVANSQFEKQEGEILLVYKALFTIVLATLVVLAICNLISLVGWLSKLLLASCRRDLGLKPEASLDMVFLVSMAWYNTSVVVAMDLAKNSVWGDNSDWQ